MPSTKKKAKSKKKVDSFTVFAGNSEQAKGFFNQHGMDPATVDQISKIDDLKGKPGKGKELICVGTYYDRNDRHSILHQAKLQGYALVDEFDWVAKQVKDVK